MLHSDSYGRTHAYLGLCEFMVRLGSQYLCHRHDLVLDMPDDRYNSVQSDISWNAKDQQPSPIMGNTTQKPETFRTAEIVKSGTSGHTQTVNGLLRSTWRSI